MSTEYLTLITPRAVELKRHTVSRVGDSLIPRKISPEAVAEEISKIETRVAETKKRLDDFMKQGYTIISSTPSSDRTEIDLVLYRDDGPQVISEAG